MAPCNLQYVPVDWLNGFGERKDAKCLWQCAIYAIVWSIWLECNSRIFTDKFLDEQVLWPLFGANHMIFLEEFPSQPC